MLAISGTINDQMIGCLIQVRTEIGPRSLARRELFQKLSENVSYNIIRYNLVMAQSQCILINCGSKLIEDSSECFFVQIFSGFEQGDSISHGVSLLPSCFIYTTQINAKKFRSEEHTSELQSQSN